MIRIRLASATLALMLGMSGLAGAAGFNADKTKLSFDELDMVKIANEDAVTDVKGNAPYRFAIGHRVNVNPAEHGTWTNKSDGSLVWKFEVATPDAAHLNFGFSPFHLPAGALLTVSSPDGSKAIGPFTDKDNAVTNQLWTPVLLSSSAVLELSLPASSTRQVQFSLVKVGHGYRGFGATAKHCKAGACNMDVVCLGSSDPWNAPRRSAGAYTLNGTDTCSGSLLNNTANDRRMIFATAGHCNITSNAIAATIVTYWNYESATCRTPGSPESGNVIPRPSTTSSGATFLARTGSTSTADFTLIEFLQPANPAYNHYWAGWDRRDISHPCAAPGNPTLTVGLCASIHHPGVDEKRITFVETNMDPSGYNGAAGVSHLHAFWDPTPPIVPGIQPPPASVVPGVTLGGSSGSPLYNANQRLVGVLSGGPSACGSTGANLSDYYGRLAIAWEGGGTSTTAMKTHLDPVGGGTAQTIDGIGQCDQPAAPTGVTAVANVSNNIAVSWTATPGITRYRVLRSDGTCPGSNFTQIAEVDNVLSYNDATVSGGSVYSYKVMSLDTVQPCESAQSTCSSATATGVCSLAPTFTGASSVTSAGSATCAINVNWNAAAPNCGGGGQMRYNIFRSTTAGFTPAPANAIQTCVSATSIVDTPLTPATPYYYVVRAEDSSGAGAGVCAAGLQDGNIAERSATPAGPDATTFADDVEAGTAPWIVVGSWSQVMTQARSPTRSWFVPDPASANDSSLSTTAAIAVPSAPGTQLEFYLRYATEPNYDGTRLEYSLDGGTTWSDILAAQGTVPANPSRFLVGGYNGAMNASGGFPSGTAWHGAFNTAWIRSSVNLTDFAGRNVNFRFHFRSDGSVAGTGFFLDDLRLFYGSACANVDPVLLFLDGFE